jgi:hypothetical protein
MKVIFKGAGWTPDGAPVSKCHTCLHAQITTPLHCAEERVLCLYGMESRNVTPGVKACNCYHGVGKNKMSLKEMVEIAYDINDVKSPVGFRATKPKANRAADDIDKTVDSLRSREVRQIEDADDET